MKTLFSFLTATLLVLALFATPSVMAYENGDLIFRAGPANVDPDASSGPIRLGGNPLDGTSVDVDSNTQLGLTFTYMINESLGVGLLAATPFEHDITETGVGVDNVGSTKHLPPTLSLQYFPAAASSTIQPYLGIGVNYTTFFSEKTSAELNNALGDSSMSLDDSVGLAFEAGVDLAINEKWLFNATVWLIDIDTDASIQTAAGLVEVDVEIDPVVIMAGIGYQF